ncbi:hypothetical protein MMMB2_1314 [Mycobacterium marinum MB2]|nr:hypothetical protein MMMB2_1314 [Mycobacterium marinum MB2]
MVRIGLGSFAIQVHRWDPHGLTNNSVGGYSSVPWCISYLPIALAAR